MSQQYRIERLRQFSKGERNIDGLTLGDLTCALMFIEAANKRADTLEIALRDVQSGIDAICDRLSCDRKFDELVKALQDMQDNIGKALSIP